MMTDMHIEAGESTWAIAHIGEDGQGATLPGHPLSDPALNLGLILYYGQRRGRPGMARGSPRPPKS